ncbi:unnamed protein product [Bathycoccus prasinos]
MMSRIGCFRRGMPSGSSCSSSCSSAFAEGIYDVRRRVLSSSSDVVYGGAAMASSSSSSNTPTDYAKQAFNNPLIKHAGEQLLYSRPKTIALSGPAGFLGSNVVDAILDAHEFRRANGLDPGELLLLSSSPGTLMARLTSQLGSQRLKTVRATRVDYYHQHDVDSWHDQLGSLGLGGCNAVFANLAGLAGPVPGKPDSMMAVNYRAPVAAARACEALGFGHFVQSSTQATKAERAGQVPYSRWKSMTDYSLARLEKLPVSITSLGLLYSSKSGAVGQRGDLLNMTDLTLLPLTPIMGNGTAPLQPLEVADAANRIAFLCLTEFSSRATQRYDLRRMPSGGWGSGSSSNNNTTTVRVGSINNTTGDVAANSSSSSSNSSISSSSSSSSTATYDADDGMNKMWNKDSWKQLVTNNQRHYTHCDNDAVGPEIMTMLELNEKFAKINSTKLTPVFVDYRNFERVLNVASLGNLNRQFVSLLRSEQATEKPIVGNPSEFEQLLGNDARLLRLDEVERNFRRRFPYWSTLKWAFTNYGVIEPGISLGLEITVTYLFGKQAGNPDNWIKTRGGIGLVALCAIAGGSAYLGAEFANVIVAFTPPSLTPPTPPPTSA